MYLDQQCEYQSVGTMNGILKILIQTLISSHCSISSTEVWPKDYAKTAMKYGLQEYDFVIVGSGAAGSVLAERLSDNYKWNILVIEAGRNPPSESVVPFFFKTMYNTSADWRFRASKSKKFARGLKDGVYISSGKMLGGSSSLNAMFYVRGNRKDYKTWAKYGNHGWDFDSNLDYFKRSENMLIKEIRDSYDGKYHSKGGLLKVDYFNYNDPTKRILLKAIKESGSNQLIDINGDDTIGVIESTGTLTGGRRYSAVRAFLRPAGKRKNVHIIKNAFVTSLSNDYHGKITGVKFNLRGKSFTAVAKKEYILAAGPVKTPQIMMLSGIGPASYLKYFDIDTIADLKGVGRNLQDQIHVPYFIKVPCNISFTDHEITSEYYKYLTKSSGAFASPSCSELLTFMNSKDSYDKNPDLQITYTLYSREDGKFIKEALKSKGYGSDVVISLLYLIPNHCIIKIVVTLLHPKSRGQILLRSKDSYDKPRIHLNYLDDKRDIQSIVRGIRLQKKLLATKSFKHSNIREIVLRLNECYDIEYDSDDYWKCYIKYLGSSLWQLSGTTKMGPAEDENAVVDRKLRVHGFKNLRISGSSIFPSTISGVNRLQLIWSLKRRLLLLKNNGMKKNTQNQKNPNIVIYLKNDLNEINIGNLKNIHIQNKCNGKTKTNVILYAIKIKTWKKTSFYFC